MPTAPMSGPPAILLLGPTAAGKTALAMHLADRFPVEIISVDSALVYRGMDIGTAKPDAATRQRYPHHLVDLIDPTDSYSAARFCADAKVAMTQIVARGKVPLLVGGTMLYARALLGGLSDLPEANASVRAELESRALKVGWPAMHQELLRVDPQTAQRLKPADSQRIQRARGIHDHWQANFGTPDPRRPADTLCVSHTDNRPYAGRSCGVAPAHRRSL